MDRTEALVHDRWKQHGFESLLPEEQGYVAVWWFAMEVNNGGFDQYFRNNSGDAARLALDMLHQSEARETHSLLRAALLVFEQVGGYRADREARNSRLDKLPANAFDDLESQFYDGQEHFMSKVLSVVAQAHIRANV
ncbi:DUF4375 domain-containing protein [Pseudoxanthomonas sp. JBR18]|uniref:DMP19 family protein n=1 Tax=Pseudoxanthomonas sp. JBR18 TaxID=2969308 RepID=UPI00230670FD|nr:DUF4375 domain-containing protein [Pseudoxanthomonas sp. JBR18]WCE05981.1 DUF4375 domain-containing protein [Pseudoxanthomonas sp. JBR18]